MRGFAETNHHRRTVWKTPEECYNGASTWAVPSLAPKFSVKKNETALPVLVSGFRTRKTTRTSDPGRGTA